MTFACGGGRDDASSDRGWFMRQRFPGLLWIVVALFVGIVVGRMSHLRVPRNLQQPVVKGGWPEASDSGPQALQDVDFHSLFLEAKVDSCVVCDKFAVIVLDRLGTLDQLQLHLSTQLTLNGLLKEAQKQLIRKILEVGS